MEPSDLATNSCQNLRQTHDTTCTGALLYRLTHHVHILEMNGESYRLKCSRENAQPPAPDDPDEE